MTNEEIEQRILRVLHFAERGDGDLLGTEDLVEVAKGWEAERKRTTELEVLLGETERVLGDTCRWLRSIREAWPLMQRAAKMITTDAAMRRGHIREAAEEEADDE